MPRALLALVLTALTATALLGSPSAAGQQADPTKDELAAAQAKLKDAQAKLAKTYEAFTAAEQRYKRASAAAQAAQERATKARSAADAAAKREREMRLKFDDFTSASFRQGSTIGSVSAYLGAKSPTDMLARSSLLKAIGEEHANVLETMKKAVAQKSATERQAKAALGKAVRNRDAAAKARADAERTYAAAVEMQEDAKAETQRLAQQVASLNQQQSSGGSSDSRGSGQAAVTGGVAKPAEGTLTSGYGPRGGTIHYGIDIANDIGTPIYSAMAGEVIDTGTASGFGYWVRVQHSGGLITVYGHISSWSVQVGQQVAAGEQIAEMGNEGQSTGPHLHFEVHEGGSKIDPLPWLRSHGVDI